jgi:hypothetical protein
MCPDLLFALHALALLFLKHDDLITAFVFENFSGNGRSDEAGGADFIAFTLTGGEHVFDFNGRAFFGAGIAVNDKDVALGDSELLPLGFDSGFHK